MINYSSCYRLGLKYGLDDGLKNALMRRQAMNPCFIYSNWVWKQKRRLFYSFLIVKNTLHSGLSRLETIDPQRKIGHKMQNLNCKRCLNVFTGTALTAHCIQFKPWTRLTTLWEQTVITWIDFHERTTAFNMFWQYFLLFVHITFFYTGKN